MTTRILEASEQVVSTPGEHTCLPSLDHIHSSKRGNDERKGMHTWHPYYAGYSEQFVRDIIEELATPNAIILDPWNGSGTTTVVAQQHGYRSIGIEINPVMVVHARAKTLSAKDMSSLRQMANRIVHSAERHLAPDPTLGDPIYEYVPATALRPLLSLQNAIWRGRAPSTPHPLMSLIKTDAFGKRNTYHPFVSFLLSALFQCLRKVGSFRRGSNPTWLLKSASTYLGGDAEIFDLFRERIQHMLTDISEQKQIDTLVRQALILEGDTRSLPLCDSSIDLIITSPPYCTRIDYTISTTPELTLLGNETVNITKLRKATMGAPVIGPRVMGQKNEWGQTCQDFLATVEAHPSKASKSYYLPIFQQYFSDAFVSIAEMQRVLKPGGYAAIVVQSSYYKEVNLLLGQVYTEMAKSLKLDATIARRETVRQHMANLNKASKKYVSDKTYYEDIVLVRKS